LSFIEEILKTAKDNPIYQQAWGQAQKEVVPGELVPKG